MSRLKKAVEQALQEGCAYELTLDAVRADGTLLRCLARGQVEKDETGTVRRLYGSLQELPS